MKKLQILIIAFLISLSICALTTMQAKAATGFISLSKSSGYVGDTVTVSAIAGNGFDQQWIVTINFDGAPQTQVAPDPYGAFTASFTVPVTTAGSHTVSATDLNGNTALATFTVFAPLAVTVSPTSWIMDVGQSKTFTATPAGGSGVYSSYQWYVGGVVRSGATASSFSYTAGSVGVFSITATVTDSLGTISVQSSGISVTVAASPTVSVLPVGPITLDVGQVQVFTATPSGGSGAIHYQWHLDGGVVGSDSSSYSYTAAGVSHSVTCNVTDSASTPVASPASNAVSVMVNPALVAPTVTPTPSSINQGQTSSLTSSAVSTGTSPYTYQWLAKAPGASSYSAISGANLSSYSFVTSGSTTTGAWSFELQVTDSASTPVVVISTATSVTVNAVPTVSVSPGSATLDVGQSKTFNASASGGTGSFSYQWYLGGSAVSGQTGTSYSFTASSAGSPTIYVRVTDQASSPSTVQSNTPTVTVNSAPTVSVLPVVPVILDVGQVQVFTATSSGGSGTIHYQWYLDSSTVGTDSTNYSYTAAGTSHSVTCKVTDTASTPVTSPASNAVSITVNPALVAPTISASAGTINQGQTSSLTSTTVSTGTSPYTYQWLQKAPGGSYAAVGSNSPSFSFVTSGAMATGSWSFMLQVTDAAGAAVNSSAITVTVNTAPLDHFVFSSVGVQTAGTPFSVTITAKNAFNNTLTNYSGTNILNVSIGTISPAVTGVFSNGVWTGSVTVTGAGSGIWLFTSGSGMLGTSGTFTVNPGVLDHFTFSIISTQTVGSSFDITVTALDAFGNPVVGYAGTPSLTYSAGSISPATLNAFVNGVGSTSVTVTGAGSAVTITATDNTYIGTSNSFIVTTAPTPAPTATPPPTSTSTPTSTPRPTTAPTPTPSPTPIPSTTNVTAATDSGAKVNLAISGNITTSQISNATITLYQPTKTIIVSFTVTGPNGTTGFSNMTIPKTAINYGTAPVVYIDGQQALNQSYTQDLNNFYVWYITEFTTHQVKIQFAESSTSQATFAPMLAVGISVPEIILIYTLIAVRRLKQKPDTA